MNCGKNLFFGVCAAPWPAPKDRLDHWVAYAVVHDQWKLAVNNDHSHAELFDLVQDPLERKNISQEYPKIVVALQDMLGEWLTSLPRKPTGKVFSKLRGQ